MPNAAPYPSALQCLDVDCQDVNQEIPSAKLLIRVCRPIPAQPCCLGSKTRRSSRAFPLSLRLEASKARSTLARHGRDLLCCTAPPLRWIDGLPCSCAYWVLLARSLCDQYHSRSSSHVPAGTSEWKGVGQGQNHEEGRGRASREESRGSCQALVRDQRRELVITLNS